ncbi:MULTISPECIES: class I adenylate-forming enzyme family protein [Polaromonas]|uniref:Class I adenylate-forming enzyme family protein n=1 Tax=Polaromonas aquatica TaxID=332657 RepID=A0ABW1U205_9BURK
MFPIDLLVKAARATPDAIAFQDEQRTLTFSELLSQACALAAAIQQLTGLRRPRVAVLSPNSLEMAIGIMAIHAGGFWLIPLNPRDAKAEVQRQVALVKPDLFIIDAAHAEGFDTCGMPVIYTGIHGHDEDSHETIAHLVSKHHGEKPVFAGTDPSEPNAIKFTGGSSGRPKAVVQSFRTVNTVASTVATAFDLQADEVYLLTAPMTHGAGAFMLPVLSRGGRCVIIEKPRPASIAGALEKFGATMTWMPPTLLYMLMEVPGIAAMDLSHMRHLIWSGAPATVEKLKQARALFGNVIESAYGQAEASSVATVMRAHDVVSDEDFASAGRPTLLSHVEIAGPDGSILPVGETGEIIIRGDIRMIEYLEMPDITAQTVKGGWVHTGDIGMFDARGYLFIKGRLRDVVISGGFNVYPLDVEDVLCRNDAVQEAVVFGVPDEKWGERVEAAVMLRAGATAHPEQLMEFARQWLGAVKTPKAIHIVESLPRSNVGKVLRREVRSQFIPSD